MSSPNSVDAPVYWPELDGLRSLAFLFVFLSHCPPPAGGSLLRLANRYCGWGWLGVDLFFVLSGFLITYLLVKEKCRFGNISITDFYKRRALRIWPLYFTMLFLISLFPLLIHHWNSQFRTFIEAVVFPFFAFAGNYAMIWNWGIFNKFCEGWGIPFTVYVGLLVPLWSLCIEEQFYLFWPSLLRFARSIKFVYALIGFLFVFSFVARFLMVTYALQHGLGHSFYYMDIFFHLDSLMTGAAIAVAEYKHPSWFKKYTGGAGGWLFLAFLLLVFTAIPLFVPAIYDRSITIVPTLSVAAVSFGVLLILTKTWEPLQKLFRSPILRSIGRVSYAMYVFHLFIIVVIESHMPVLTRDQNTNWALRALLSLLATWIAAQISWHLIEKRFLKARAKFARVKSKVSALAADNFSCADIESTAPLAAGP